MSKTLWKRRPSVSGEKKLLASYNLPHQSCSIDGSGIPQIFKVEHSPFVIKIANKDNLKNITIEVLINITRMRRNFTATTTALSASFSLKMNK